METESFGLAAPHRQQGRVPNSGELAAKRLPPTRANRSFRQGPRPPGNGRCVRQRLVANAALDRLTHHGHIMAICGQSYRQPQERGAGRNASLARRIATHGQNL
ncbi:ATP-binding protein [Plantactinospora sp. WMMC1484]|uniref:ATP-binding protein n=1 Tax=Plantactinospora sp. WMMC1484 TaxID=3404122 RepID=UPI003BF60D4F